MDRREFLETSALLAGGALLTRVAGASAAEPPMIGMQAGAVSFVDEGTDKVLDNPKQMGAVNTIFLATFTYGRGIAGRQVPYTQLSAWAARLRPSSGQAAGDKPADGAFVTFWRLLVKYPEILQWERLWNEALNDTYRDMYRRAHEIAPSKGIGWHVWHNNSFSPFYRAEQDYADFSQYSDFLKVVSTTSRAVSASRSTSGA